MYLTIILIIICIYLLSKYLWSRNEPFENINKNYKHDSSKNTNLFVIAGNCRTFLDCVDSCIGKLVTKLDPENNNEIFFYLKLKDERTKEDKLGPKNNLVNKDNIDIAIYPTVTYDEILNKIKEINNNYKFNIYYKIIDKDEIGDTELLNKIKNMSLYSNFTDGNSSQRFLLRSLHQSYNAYICGNYIKEIEKINKYKYDTFIYLRPDMYFTNNSYNIDDIPKNTIVHMSDHISIVPNQYFNEFFYGRMKIFETNNSKEYHIIEEIFIDSLKQHEEYKFVEYYLKRK
jgi:hypothetical protein